jgi:hypothetical protein
MPAFAAARSREADNKGREIQMPLSNVAFGALASTKDRSGISDPEPLKLQRPFGWRIT